MLGYQPGRALLPSGRFQHGVGPVCLCEQGVQLGTAKAEASGGSPLGFEFPSLDPATDRGYGDSQMTACVGGVDPGLGFRGGDGVRVEYFHIY